MKYRKKPVVIEAVEWTGENHREMYSFLTNDVEGYMQPISFQFIGVLLVGSGKTFYIDHSKVKGGLVIRTLEGEHIASIGDYIIKGVKGEFYPCKPDIFHKTYEKVEEE